LAPWLFKTEPWWIFYTVDSMSDIWKALSEFRVGIELTKNQCWSVNPTVLVRILALGWPKRPRWLSGVVAHNAQCRIRT
jgi:hypothetical protein